MSSYNEGNQSYHMKFDTCALSPVCAAPSWRVANLTLSCIIIIVNLFHIFILNKMKLNSNFASIVKNMSISDLFIGILSAAASLCRIQTLFIQYPISRKIFRSMTIVTIYNSYTFIIVGLFERYVAICHPVKGRTWAIFHQCNWRLFMLGVWLYCIILASLTNMLSDISCVNGLVFPSPELNGERNPASMTSLSLYVCYLVIGGIFYGIIRRELNRRINLRGQSRAHTQQTRRMKETINFLTGVIVAYIIVLTPFFFVSFAHSRIPEFVKPEYNYIAMMIANTGPIVNCIIYGWRNDKYTRAVKKCLQCSKGTSTIIVRRVPIRRSADDTEFPQMTQIHSISKPEQDAEVPQCVTRL